MNAATHGKSSLSAATKAVVAVVVAAVALAAIGYVSATASLAACKAATRDTVAAAGIRGVRFGGEVETAEDFRYIAEIDYPFVVRCEAVVPRDLHSTILEYRYFGFFGLLLPLDHQAIHL